MTASSFQFQRTKEPYLVSSFMTDIKKFRNVSNIINMVKWEVTSVAMKEQEVAVWVTSWLYCLFFLLCTRHIIWCSHTIQDCMLEVLDCYWWV